MFPDSPMILTAHLSKAIRRTDHCRLRSSKCLPRFQRPAEMIRMNPHDQTAVLKLTALHSRFKVAAVQKHSAVTHPLVFISIMIAENYEGIVLMAGYPAHTAHTEYPGTQWSPVRTPLHQMACVEGKQIHIIPEKIQAERSALI